MQAPYLARRCLLALILALPAVGQAADSGLAPADGAAASSAPAAPTLSDLGRSLRNYFTEDELKLLFEYMRDSVIASFKGEEVSLPPDLAFKLEVLLVRLKKEGGHYMDNLIRQLEKDLERNLKEKLAPPAPAGQPVYTPPAPPASVPLFTPPVYQPPAYQPPPMPVFSWPFLPPWAPQAAPATDP
jgi:hypothetical protein